MKARRELSIERITGNSGDLAAQARNSITGLFQKPFVYSPIEKCIIDKKVFYEMEDFLKTRQEFGGALIGKCPSQDIVHIYSAIFPPQTRHSPTFCEFQSSHMVPILTAFESAKMNDYGFVGWVHSHPNLDLYLSETDKTTYRFLLKQNPQLLAVVIDPFQTMKAVAFANKGDAFIPKAIGLELEDLEIERADARVLNMIKLKSPETKIISPYHKNNIILDSICDLQAEVRELREQIETLTVGVSHHTGLRRRYPSLTIDESKRCPNCLRLQPKEIKYCMDCGTKLHNSS